MDGPPDRSITGTTVVVYRVVVGHGNNLNGDRFHA